ncbi:MAG TPA: cellulase family glycosylhydrolase [Ignavibacteriales bacterium]|nr:cellulase family glycosylhydrolase [Ignavibacteriales bacterium]
MRKILLPLLCMLFAASVLTAQTKGFVTVKGKEIVDASGKPILLKGINLGNWLVPEGYMFKFGKVSSPRLINEMFSEVIGPVKTAEFWTKFRDNYITEKDIQYIKSAGFNSVRIPFNYNLFTVNDDTNRIEGVGFKYLDSAIVWCERSGVWAILDMHCAPGGQTGDNIDDSFGYPFFFEDTLSQKLAIKIWAALAERYKDKEIVIGYDFLNEPIAHYFEVEKLNPRLEPFFKKISAEIRKIDPNHIFFIAGAQWNSNFKIFGEPFDSKLVYTFHKYWTPATQEVIQDYIDFGSKHNVPFWLGESGENTNEWIDSFRVVLEKNNIGWCFWPYKKMDSPRCIATFDTPGLYDALIKYSEAPRDSFAKIRENKPSRENALKALDEFIKNCRFENCRMNDGYLKALFGNK